MDKIYSFDEIKRRGDCIRFVREVLMLPVDKGRCAATWRGGKNPQSVSLEQDRFYDHGAKAGGSIIDLCAVSKCNGDIMQAASVLGDWLGLDAKDVIHERDKLIATHQYVDPATGKVLHETLRFRTEDGGKRMSQRRPDPNNAGKHIYSLDGIDPILYRMSDWKDSAKVVIVEGEKCADAVAALGIPATTNPMGAGYWRDSFNAYFTGKVVAILPDNDDTGTIHAHHVADAIGKVAKAVKVVPLPGLEPKEDVYEWINKYGHTKDELTALINAAPVYVHDHVREPTQKELASSSVARDHPLRNFQMKKIVTASGSDESKPAAVPINSIVSDLRARFFGFPSLIGDTLFDHDRATNRILPIRDCNALFAWISSKTDRNYVWKRKEGFTTREELFAAVYASSSRYQMISGVPHWPLRSDVYYTYGEIPAPVGGKLDEFTRLFSFSTEEDRLLYKVFLATLIYYRPKIDRPIWVFDSEDGQGCFAPGTMVRMFDGSTKAVENIVVGDVVMGKDSTPRNVKRLFSGKEEMFKFTYSNGDSHTVNKSHDLYLIPLRSDTRYGNKNGGRDGIIVPVSEYLTWSMRKKLNFGVIRQAVTSYPERDLPIPPYILGCWLGDGSRNATSITNIDPEVVSEWKDYGESMGLNAKTYSKDRAPTIHLVATPGQKNPMRTALMDLGCWMNKSIPESYMRGSMSQRLELIAGLIDTDGCKERNRSLIITQKNRALSYQILDLCRSVGISTTIRARKKHCWYKGKKREGTYYYIYLNRNTDIVPIKIKRKKIDPKITKQKKYLHYAIKSVEPVGVGQFLGFELDGDHLFLGADYTVLKNSGKTKAAEYAALLVGGDDPDCGEPLWVDYKQLESDQALQVVVKRLLSASGRKKRMFLLDNVEGYFRSPALATLVTQGSISGMAPYGKGEETRPNDLVYVVTCNSATLSRDIISRSMIIKMRRSEVTSKRWNDKVERFIRNNRMQIVAEIVELLDGGLTYDLVPATRFATWELDVCGPMLQDAMTLCDVWKHSETSKQDSDADSEEADIITETIAHKVGDYVQDQDECVVWLQAGLLADWCIEAIPGFGGHYGRNVKSKLKNLCKVGLLPRLKYRTESGGKFQHVRGAAWIGEKCSDDATPTHILRKLPSGQTDLSTVY